MRPDSAGFWWRDEPPVKKKKKVQEKRTPPKPFWLDPGYLPPDELPPLPHVMNDADLAAAHRRKDRLLFDVESYWNYFIVTFMSYATGAIVYFELTGTGATLARYQQDKLNWILAHFNIVGFNSHSYDIPIVTLAAAGCSCETMKKASNEIILQGWRPGDVLRPRKVKRLKEIDHIDLIEVAPLDGSLKTYGGRLFTPRMQDLPFHPEATLTVGQIDVVRKYNTNDLIHTAFLLQALQEQIKLREIMSMEFHQDLRSKSDAQVAEAVIGNEWKRLNAGEWPKAPVIEPGTAYLYKVPSFLQFASPLLQWALEIIRTTQFTVAQHGSIEMPKSVADLHLQIGSNVYRMGLGGLHSSETISGHVAGADFIISDRDVTSYYPQIILNQGLYPKHLGQSFLRIYGRIVERRLAAKKRDKKHPDVESLKIVVNGTFGKTGSKYSIFYSPDILIQVTLTGQLALLMLIERLEIVGIQVVSANTDGVVIKCRRDQEALLNEIIQQWEKETCLPTEETRYDGYYTRDVNNYIAVKEGKTGIKAKGVFLNPWNDPKLAIFRLHKNPVNTVTLEAIEALLTKAIPVDTTIRSCTDVRKFTALRKVTGGAVCGDKFLGKVIRWYQATGQQPEIIYAKNGNKVPASSGARPLMQLPQELPTDIDYDWYIKETHAALVDIGYEAPPASQPQP